jgi:hypothetical protein
MEHPDEDVQRAITRLCDALCTWERMTGRRSILVLREEGGFVFRADSGKPGIPGDIPDAQLLEQISAGGAGTKGR